MRLIEGKVIVLGSRGVGKTRIITKYMKNALQRETNPSTAVSFFICKVKLGNDKIKMNISDTADQERYKALAPMYYRNANAAILVFDLTQRKTFTEIDTWIQEVIRHVPDPMVYTLVGNKLDKPAERVVSHDEAFRYAMSIGARYFETSAEHDQGLEELFMATAQGLLRMADEGKSRTLHQAKSTDMLSIYANTPTVFTYTAQVMAAKSNGTIHLPHVEVGRPVDGEDIVATGVGRLETPSWSIDNIAIGEVVHVNSCCFI